MNVLCIPGLYSVPQGHVAIVERFGQYMRTLEPGLNWINPVTESIKNLSAWQGRATKLNCMIETTDQLWPREIQCLTKDQFEVTVHFVLRFKIAEKNEARRTVYAVGVFPDSLEAICIQALQSKISMTDSGEIFSSRQKISASIRQDLAETVKRWGARLVGVEIGELRFDPTISAVLQKKSIAETELTNAKIEAETSRVKAENEAETSRIRTESDARNLLVEANANANQRQIINDAEAKYVNQLVSILGSPARTVQLLTAEKVSNAFAAAAGNTNAKTIVLPVNEMLKLVHTDSINT